MEVTVAHCKKSLATVWFGGAGVVFFVVLVQSLLGRYGESANEAWGWLLPTVMPTLSLIVGVLMFDAVQKEKTPKTIDRFLFRLTLSLSFVYLAAVFLVIALQPLAAMPPLQMMTQANVWLGPFQGLVTAAMGAFFVKAAHSENLTKSSASGETGPAAKSA
jgi:hypothetical protein